LPALVSIASLDLSNSFQNKKTNEEEGATVAISGPVRQVDPDTQLVADLQIIVYGLAGAPVKPWQDNGLLGHLDPFYPSPRAGLSTKEQKGYLRGERVIMKG